jgi:hypothetical protein
VIWLGEPDVELGEIYRVQMVLLREFFAKKKNLFGSFKI